MWNVLPSWVATSILLMSLSVRNEKPTMRRLGLSVSMQMPEHPASSTRNRQSDFMLSYTHSVRGRQLDSTLDAVIDFLLCALPQNGTPGDVVAILDAHGSDLDVLRVERDLDGPLLALLEAQ